MSDVATPLARSPRERRDEVEQLIRDDLIGPLGGDEEELEAAPVDRYLLGLLAPRRCNDRPERPARESGVDPGEEITAADEVPGDELAAGGVVADSGEEGTVEERPAALHQLVPSAFGMTFALEPGCTRLLVDARWGAYSRATSDEKLDYRQRPARVWRRRACGGERAVAIPPSGEIKPYAPDGGEPEVLVRGLVRERGAQRLVTLFLLNEQRSEPGRSSPERWLAQARLAVRAPGDAPVFVRRAIDVVGLSPEVDQAEIGGLEMLYRDTTELAVGHGVGVETTGAEGARERGVRIATACMPATEVALTEAPEPRDFAADPAIGVPFAKAAEAFDMQRLAEAAPAQLAPLLTPLVDAYEAWIARQRERSSAPEAGLDAHAPAADAHLADATEAAERMRAGIAVLADPDVAEAFAFANHAMWQQRIHAIAGELRRKDDRLRLPEAIRRADIARNRSWRPFQLAFVLVNLPALADPRHPERASGSQAGLVDLLFFPTGGGKTEAYLGLTAFAIAIRRLQGTAPGARARTAWRCSCATPCGC